MLMVGLVPFKVGWFMPLTTIAVIVGLGPATVKETSKTGGASFLTGKAARGLRMRIAARLATWSNAVKPPLLIAPRVVELSARLKKNWLVALSALPPCLAMAMVPTTSGWLALNSFLMAGLTSTGMMRLGSGWK